ncbi:methylenetetrahydrofolate reductase [Actinomadura rupiterrae]|uniref:methylenetetrahydrofolate reductase n=1 Tax=Actinomadura rupiterrae TaxID=559627 RepID=UPI0020A5390B|nr:methylenetetrahydrofolate reductase [Actinomadura rupiterrae]MCP2341466.1 5,10-methylenetetrahydrofolate reductase [Actinomadura rupiterrae]
MAFELLCEIEPPTRPDLSRVRHQIEVLGPVAGSFLVPDTRVGQATVSSLTVAHEVAALGAAPVACLNSRDRNLVGLRRDLLTAATYGVRRLLFVYGDRPSAGGRAGDLTVRTMIDEARAFEDAPPFEVGVTTGLRPVPAWKRAADFVLTQVTYATDDLMRWRDTAALDGPVYAGVLVLASGRMARRVTAAMPDIAIPDDLVDAVDRDPDAGVDAACAQIEAIRASGAFDGVHLVPVSRYADVAARLGARGFSRSSGRR